MRRLLAGLLLALLPSLALGQAATIANGACRLDGVDCGVTASGVATAGTIAVWGSGPALGSFDWLTATDATKTVALPKGTLNAGLVKATALGTPGSITVTPVLSKVASITTVAGASLVDGDYLTVEYDTGLTVPIEFDATPGDGTTGGRVPYVFAPGDSADDIRDGLITLLNGAVPAQLTASSGGAATVSIVLDTPGAVGGTLTENVAAGGFAVTGFADPTAATTVTYKLVAHLADGTATEAGAASSTAASTATLSAANFLRLTWSAVTGAASYDVYRTVAPTSPATTGKIIASTAALTLDDTGLAGGGETAPTSNSTGRLVSTALTSGRIPLVSTGGAIVDDSGLTYSGTGTGTVLRIGSTGTGLSEISAGVVGVGTGAAGSAAGELQATTLTSLGLMRVAHNNVTVNNTVFAAGSASVPYLVVGNGPLSGFGGYARVAMYGTPLHVYDEDASILMGNAADARLTRRAAATLQLGAADSATPVAQTIAFQGSRGGTDTNTAGQDATIQGSLGTGTAASGKLVFKVGTPQGSGSDQHVAATVLTLQNTGTSGTATPQVGIGGAPDASEVLHVMAPVGRFRLTSTTGTNYVSMYIANTGGAFVIGENNSTGTALVIANTAAGSADYAAVINHAGAHPLIFGTSNTERVRIAATGEMIFGGPGTFGSKTKTLTDATPVAFATIPLATGAATGGRLIYRVVATDGATARQVVSGSINYAAVRDGATYAVDYDEIQQSTAVTSGTLTGAVTAAGASDLLTFSANFDTDLGTPVLTIYYRFDSTDTLAVTGL